MLPERLILVLDYNSGQRQIVLEGGYTFVRSTSLYSMVLDPADREVRVPHVGSPTFRTLRGDACVAGFTSLENLAACNRAVPENATVVVITGNHYRNATIFRGDGLVSVRTPGLDADDLEISRPRLVTAGPLMSRF